MLNDLAPHPWPPRGWRVDVALAFATYALLAYACIVVARQPGTIAVVWMANGAAIALIVSAAPARAPALLLAGMLGNLAANLAYGDGLLVSATFLLPNVAEVALGAWLVRRRATPEAFAISQRGLVQLLSRGALLPPLLGATAGATVLQLLGFARFDKVWLDWYVGAALGSVAVLPLVLALRGLAPGGLRARLGKSQTVAVLVAVPAASLAVLNFSAYPFVGIGVLMLAAAFTQPRLVTFFAAPLVVAALALALSLGWYQPLTPDTPLGHALVYLSALLVVVPAQLVAVLVARQRALDDMLAAVSSRDHEIVTFMDMAGVYRWVSRSRQAYRGTPNEDILGRTVGELAERGAVDNSALPRFLAARDGQVQREVMDIDYAVRGRRVMDIHVQPALDEEGRQIGVISSALDVTEREQQRDALERAAQRLQDSNHRLEQFVRIASHDLREPLNTIVQFTGLIQQEQAAALNDSGRLYFQQVHTGAERLRRMLDDVLAYVRLDEAPPEAPQPVALDGLVQEVLAGLQAQVDRTGAQVHVGPLGTVQGHATLLALLLQNLISNALKFQVPGTRPQLTVRARREGGALRLSVADNGIGIDTARLPELGEPFRRLHARRKYEGTGLGLSICKRIAHWHGGHLHIESTAGRGSTFTLVVPPSA